MSEERTRVSEGRDELSARGSASALRVNARDDLREILITVSPGQFETFANDLRLLREHGAESNTRAIIDAVRERAARIKLGAVDDRKAA